MRRLPLGSCTQRMDLEAPWVSSPRVPAWDLGRWQIPQWALKRKLHSGPGKTYSFSHLATGLLWRQGRKWCFTVCPAVCSFLCWRLVECLGDQNSTLSSLSAVILALGFSRKPFSNCLNDLKYPGGDALQLTAAPGPLPALLKSTNEIDLLSTAVSLHARSRAYSSFLSSFLGMYTLPRGRKNV